MLSVTRTEAPTVHEEGVLANPDETWEKSYKFNVGFDLELWRGLSFTMNYFNEKRRDVLGRLFQYRSFINRYRPFQIQRRIDR
ncbi:TonB-dependent receptor [Bacteroides salyersiae]|nr:TonB-dependent receptor [Bacteroides salyersiae]